MKAGSTSQITSNQHVPILNIATNQILGYVSSEYLHTCARIGLVFLHHDEAWKILHITAEETILVLPAKKLDTIVQTPSIGLKPETHEMRLKKTGANSRLKLPTPTDEVIVLESYRDYIIIHTLLGLRINMTLRLVFDALLTEQDMIRDSYSDSIRILLRTPARITRDEFEAIRSDLIHIGPREFDRLIIEGINARLPQVLPKQERPREKRQVEEKRKGELKAKLEIRQSRFFFRKLAEGRVKTRILFAAFRPTPLAKEIIDEYVMTSAEELDALIKRNAADLKRAIERETVHLLCLNCLSSQDPMRISKIGDRPKCKRCGSSLLGLPVPPVETIRSLFHKKKSMKLSEAETEILAGTRRTADLILSYGKKAIFALSVTGIGPQTASSILASTSVDDSRFFSELLRACIHYLTTRELWERR